MKTTMLWAIAAVVCALGLTVAFASRQSEANRGDTQSTGTPSAHKAAEKRIPVLVELFTSEGCSSCPPADALLAKLAQSAPVNGAEIIPLEEHVDYWNHLGWADPFSSAQFSDRQRSYAEAFRLDSVYTPEMVVDGSREFVGSEDGTARAAIAEAVRTPKVAVQITKQVQQEQTIPLEIHVGALKPQSGEETHVVLAITEDNLRSSIKRGENAGRNLTHIGVVRKWSVLGETHAQEPFVHTANIALENGWKTESLHAVVFVQGRQSGKVYGAATVRLAKN